MKLVKPFARTCYSEVLVSESSAVADNEHEDGSLGGRVLPGYEYTRCSYFNVGFCVVLSWL